MSSGYSQWLSMEFGALRSEIDRRSKDQMQCLYWLMAFTGAILGFSAAVPGRSWSLLLIPLSTYVIALVHYKHQCAIMRAADYIREEIEPRIKAALGDPAYEGWETRLRRQRLAHAESVGFRFRIEYLFPIVSTIVPLLAIPVVIRSPSQDLMRLYSSLDLPSRWQGFVWILWGLAAIAVTLQVILAIQVGDLMATPEATESDEDS